MARMRIRGQKTKGLSVYRDTDDASDSAVRDFGEREKAAGRRLVVYGKRRSIMHARMDTGSNTAPNSNVKKLNAVTNNADASKSSRAPLSVIPLQRHSNAQNSNSLIVPTRKQSRRRVIQRPRLSPVLEGNSFVDAVEEDEDGDFSDKQTGQILDEGATLNHSVLHEIDQDGGDTQSEGMPGTVCAIDEEKDLDVAGNSMQSHSTRCNVVVSCNAEELGASKLDSTHSFRPTESVNPAQKLSQTQLSETNNSSDPALSSDSGQSNDSGKQEHVLSSTLEDNQDESSVSSKARVASSSPQQARSNEGTDAEQSLLSEKFSSPDDNAFAFFEPNNSAPINATDPDSRAWLKSRSWCDVPSSEVDHPSDSGDGDSNEGTAGNGTGIGEAVEMENLEQSQLSMSPPRELRKSVSFTHPVAVEINTAEDETELDTESESEELRVGSDIKTEEIPKADEGSVGPEFVEPVGSSNGRMNNHAKSKKRKQPKNGKGSTKTRNKMGKATLILDRRDIKFWVHEFALPQTEVDEIFLL
ncbi:hypothetical protein HDU78_003630 [Chytriomyces hyalinus]|nr:hypothetical protein HDU78_003630 [Chytriomyces hyalinus]